MKELLVSVMVRPLFTDYIIRNTGQNQVLVLCIPPLQLSKEALSVETNTHKPFTKQTSLISNIGVTL